MDTWDLSSNLKNGSDLSKGRRPGGVVGGKWGGEKGGRGSEEVAQGEDRRQCGETRPALRSDTSLVLRLGVQRTGGSAGGDRAGKPVGAERWTALCQELHSVGAGLSQIFARGTAATGDPKAPLGLRARSGLQGGGHRRGGFATGFQIRSSEDLPELGKQPRKFKRQRGSERDCEDGPHSW